MEDSDDPPLAPRIVVLRARTVSEIEAHELSVVLTTDKTEATNLTRNGLRIKAREKPGPSLHGPGSGSPATKILGRP